MYSKLFIDSITPIDDHYGMVRDCKRQEILRGKNYMEDLWKRCHRYLDKDFPKKLSEDFHARFWEMYLTSTLIERSFNVRPKLTRSKGPDILIEDLQRSIYLEAVAPGEGNQSNKDVVPKMRPGEVVQVASDKILLRYRGAIADKYKKYGHYLDRGTISSCDAYIIALNSFKIEQAVIESDLPRILQAVYPFGDLQANINTKPGGAFSFHYGLRSAIARSGKSLVSTNCFLNHDYDGLSGVLYSRIDLFNKLAGKGDDFIFVHNYFAKNSIPRGYFKFGTEYYVEEHKNRLRLGCKDWESTQ